MEQNKCFACTRHPVVLAKLIGLKIRHCSTLARRTRRANARVYRKASMRVREVG